LAILLNVHNAHIENFSGRAALIEEKAQIFAPIDTSSAGIMVVEASLGMAGYNFGAEEGADARILVIQGDSLVLSLFGEKLSARIPGGGVHRANTLAAVILATKLLDVDLSAALNLADTVIPDGRGNVIDIGGVIIVDDSYNANPASMRAAIDAFCQRRGRRKVGVLGDMRELGDESIAAHKALLENLQGFDEVFLVGDAMLQMAVSEGLLSAPVLTRNAGTIFKSLHFYPEVDESLLQDLLDSVGTDDCLLVKGSNRVFWASDFVSKLCRAISKK
jgi:UDP-N-acetylmuramoyl-tripeptide--D-alanyl-D-alanine ligase